MLLQIDVESKYAGSKDLLRELSPTIEPSEKLAIIGRNGVGKTTLFNVISGIHISKAKLSRGVVYRLSLPDKSLISYPGSRA